MCVRRHRQRFSNFRGDQDVRVALFQTVTVFVMIVATQGAHRFCSRRTQTQKAAQSSCADGSGNHRPLQEASSTVYLFLLRLRTHQSLFLFCAHNFTLLSDFLLGQIRREHQARTKPPRRNFRCQWYAGSHGSDVTTWQIPFVLIAWKLRFYVSYAVRESNTQPEATAKEAILLRPEFPGSAFHRAGW